MEPKIELLALVRGSAARYIKGTRIAAIALLAAAIAVWLLVTDATAGIVLGGLLGAMGLVAGGLSIAHQARTNRLVHTLEREPERIVWCFEVVNKHNGLEVSRTINVGLDDGQVTTMIARSPEQAARVMDHLRSVAPRATQGFTVPLRDQFHRDPGSLRLAS